MAAPVRGTRSLVGPKAAVVAPVPAAQIPYPAVPDDPVAAARALHARLCTGGFEVTVAIAGAGNGWDVLAGPTTLANGRQVERLLDEPRTGAPTAIVERVGRVAVAVQGPSEAASSLREAVRVGCTTVALAVERHVALRDAAESAAETIVLQAVIEQLLTVRDLDQVLLSIVDRTLRLLDADICGVLLREGDELRMRSCVGHRLVETARLRMRRGQGVAGLVFLTGEPAKIDNYRDDRTISQDFVALAEQEQTLSALAVPLHLHGEFLGVLEVWRRRPSCFTERDVGRMVTLAQVATIAIRNARLYEEQAGAVAQLREARDALEKQLAVLRRSSTLQRRLLTTVLEGAGLAAIARTVGSELDCRVAIYGADGRVAATYPVQLAEELPASLRVTARPGRMAVRMADSTEADAWLHPVVADGDKVGCVCLLSGTESSEMIEVAAGQVAMACSLSLLRQRAASRARAEALEQVLWDLLQGPAEHRVAARSRALQMGVPLTGSLRMVYGRLENMADIAAEHEWDTSRTDRARREMLRAVRQAAGRPGLVLAGLRGDWIVAVVANLDRPVAKELVNRLTESARKLWPGLRLIWGVSRAHGEALDLPQAFDEAKTAVSAAHRLGEETVFLYEELGIVRLLLGSGNDPDLKTFISEVAGPLIKYDRNNDGALVRTLRAFFDADCSQRTAAERLFIHHKTLRYRLERIKQLTGLDLNRHEDRMRADLALRLLQVNGTGDGETAAAC